MKTAVSLPDELFRKTDRLAKRMKLSRSALVAAALEAYIIRQQDDEITEQLNRVYAHEDSRSPEWLRRAAARTLAREPWDPGDAPR